MMAEGWSDAITEAKKKIAELEQENRRLTVLERTASEHAAQADVDVAELRALVARRDADIAEFRVEFRRNSRDVIVAENRVEAVEEQLAKVRKELYDCADASDGMCGYGQRALAVLDGEESAG